MPADCLNLLKRRSPGSLQWSSWRQPQSWWVSPQLLWPQPWVGRWYPPYLGRSGSQSQNPKQTPGLQEGKNVMSVHWHPDINLHVPLCLLTSEAGASHVADLLLVELPLLLVEWQCVASAVVGAAHTNHLLIGSLHEVNSRFVLSEITDTSGHK